MIAIVDYGIGNRLSVKNMLEFIGCECEISACPGVVGSASHLILPGVGSFDPAISKLREKESLLNAVEEAVLERKIPALGICLGMQLLFDSSEEGEEPGLGWIPGEVKHLRSANINHSKIPHMGWAEVFPANGVRSARERFYFVHSYHAVPRDPKTRLYVTPFGSGVVCGVKKDNIYGVQFHPEKSHSFGMELFKRFISGDL